MKSLSLIALMVPAVLGGGKYQGDIEVCPGEGPRYGDFKCNHDGTHRVCAKLVDENE